MLLRCESPEPPNVSVGSNSALGRCRLNVRITPRSGHVADIPDRQVRANKYRERGPGGDTDCHRREGNPDDYPTVVEREARRPMGVAFLHPLVNRPKRSR